VELGRKVWQIDGQKLASGAALAHLSKEYNLAAERRQIHRTMLQ
jgi:hypothetical protein